MEGVTGGLSKEELNNHLIYNVIEYLHQYKKDAKLDEESAEGLDVACQCLSTAFKVDVNNEANKKYSISPQTLPNVVQMGLNVQTLEQLKKGSFENLDSMEQKFTQYLSAAAKRGFFKGVAPGSTGN